MASLENFFDIYNFYELNSLYFGKIYEHRYICLSLILYLLIPGIYNIINILSTIFTIIYIDVLIILIYYLLIKYFKTINDFFLNKNI